MNATKEANAIYNSRNLISRSNFEKLIESVISTTVEI